MRLFDCRWLDYDSVAFAVFMISLGIVELLVLGIWSFPPTWSFRQC
jgi:hypothetical protein